MTRSTRPVKHAACTVEAKQEQDCAQLGYAGTPTFVKRFDNPHLQMTWHNAFIELVEADKVVFIGYSLPGAPQLCSYGEHLRAGTAQSSARCPANRCGVAASMWLNSYTDALEVMVGKVYSMVQS